MLVNSNQSQGRQHFTIAHELYHLYIEENPTPHKCNPGNGSKDPVEQCADMFASSLLMPETGILFFCLPFGFVISIVKYQAYNRNHTC